MCTSISTQNDFLYTRLGFIYPRSNVISKPKLHDNIRVQEEKQMLSLDSHSLCNVKTVLSPSLGQGHWTQYEHVKPNSGDHYAVFQRSYSNPI